MEMDRCSRDRWSRQCAQGRKAGRDDPSRLQQANPGGWTAVAATVGRGNSARSERSSRRIEVHEPLMRPVLGPHDEGLSHGVLANIGPLLRVRLLAAENVIEHPGLPESAIDQPRARAAFRCPFLPPLQELRQPRGPGAALGRHLGAEEMDVVGHDDIAPHAPTVTGSRRSELGEKNGRCVVGDETRNAVARADRDEVDGMGGKYTGQPVKMAVHGLRVGPPGRLGNPLEAPAGRDDPSRLQKTTLGGWTAVAATVGRGSAHGDATPAATTRRGYRRQERSKITGCPAAATPSSPRCRAGRRGGCGGATGAGARPRRRAGRVRSRRARRRRDVPRRAPPRARRRGA